MTSGKLISTNYKCNKCGYEDSLDWAVSGWGLKELNILFECKNCKNSMEFNAIFPHGKSKQTKVKVTEDIKNYIG